MSNKIWKKGLVIGIIVLFVGASIVPSIGGFTVEKEEYIVNNLRSNILYVGGNGTGNYTKIQDAIDNASNGDTVFVYNYSSPYYEHVWVDKSINLIGEDKNSTIIDGGDIDNVIRIKSVDIIITNIGLKNSKNTPWGNLINISGNKNIVISNNIFIGHNHTIGLFIEKSEEISIVNNSFLKGRFAVIIENSTNCTISGNIINNTLLSGIYLGSSSYNMIFYNTITGIPNMLLSGGVIITGGYNNTISHNNISLVNIGILLESSKYNDITYNKITGIFDPFNMSFSQGINIGYGYNNTISHNEISRFNHGIALMYTRYNEIIYNNLTKNSCGVWLVLSFYNNISYNNIFDNGLGLIARFSIGFAQHNWWRGIIPGIIHFVTVRRFSSIVIIFPWSTEPIKDAGI